MDQPRHHSFDHGQSDQQPEAAANRGDGRDSLFLLAGMRIAGMARREEVRVRNLSTGGLMADYPRGLDQGVPVELDIRGLGPLAGRVAWSAAGRIGVAFDRAIDPLQARKPVGAGAKTPPPRFTPGT